MPLVACVLRTNIDRAPFVPCSGHTNGMAHFSPVFAKILVLSGWTPACGPGLRRVECVGPRHAQLWCCCVERQFSRVPIWCEINPTAHVWCEMDVHLMCAKIFRAPSNHTRAVGCHRHGDKKYLLNQCDRKILRGSQLHKSIVGARQALARQQATASRTSGETDLARVVLYLQRIHRCHGIRRKSSKLFL